MLNWVTISGARFEVPKAVYRNVGGAIAAF